MPENPADETAEPSSFADLHGFLNAGSIPAGLIEIQHHGLPIEILNLPAESDITLVCFHGAAEADVRLPWFLGQGVTAGLPVSRIFISDPSLRISHDFNLAWYAGSRFQPDLQETLAVVVRRIVEETGGHNVVFFGSSAGGYASLALSRFFPISLALAVNPQISISRFYSGAVERYLTHAWGVEGKEMDGLPASVTHDLVPAYSAGFDHTVALIQNAKDWFHIQNHQLPFVDAVGESDSLFMLMDRWGPDSGDGHIPPPKELLRACFEVLATCNGDWSKALVEFGFQAETTRRHVKQRVMDTAPAATAS
ncbi:YqiA/YcfP family alpha/beta fold hydrolase [Paenarthrobacter sp. NyZ202]|uniref:YqiA/YcfP family alpha/beta fold hydrolase n=1 Tax=Paenarthrobacter sp. NyZ202 TaxID=3402689 RepID=UPI003CF24DF1